MAPKAGTLAPPASTLPAPPQLPGDPDDRAAALAALADDELAALEADLIRYFEENATAARSSEDVAQLAAVTEAAQSVRSVRDERAAAVDEVQGQVAELAAQLQAATAATADPDPDGDPADGDPPAEEPDGDTAPGQGDPPAQEPPATTGVPVPEAVPGTSPAAPTPPANPETGEAPAPTARAASGNGYAATLAEIAARMPIDRQPRPEPTEGRVTITASMDVPGHAAGQRLNSIQDIARALIEKHHVLGLGRGGPDDNVPVVRFSLDYPDSRFLSSQETMKAIQAKVDALPRRGQALTAAGGLCAPTAGYYDQMVIAGSMTPVIDALANFGADRGGIRFNPPPKLPQITSGVGYMTAAQDAGQGGAFADAATTNTSTTITSATAGFTFSDIGRPISGAGIPANTTIAGVTNPTTAILSQAATATATGVAITITRAYKPTFVVTCPGIVETVVMSVFTSWQFGVFLGRSFPEQVEAWTQLFLALTARTRETLMLDAIAANSTATTAAGLVGGGREIIARSAQAATGYRSRNRMDDDAPLDLLVPAWVPRMMASDFTRSPATDPEIIGMQKSRAEMYLRNLGIRPVWYLDSKTGGNQVFAAQSAGVLNQYPATCLTYMFSPGSFLHLDAGTLDLGLIRDSALAERNNMRMFSETFENVAYVGVESLEISMALQPTGAAANGVAVASPIIT